MPRRKRQQPATASIFTSGEDLPLFTGAAPRANWRPFIAQEYVKQETLFNLVPRFGEDEPSYQPTHQEEEK
jgi:hypothetical protein